MHARSQYFHDHKMCESATFTFSSEDRRRLINLPQMLLFFGALELHPGHKDRWQFMIAPSHILTTISAIYLLL